MQCGISSACLYPCETKDALAQIARLQAGPVEIFLNTFRELDEDYLAGLARTVRAAGCRVTSLHPFTCALEPFLFFTEYQNRFEDGVALYRRYFHACQLLGAPLLVLHGDSRAKPGDMKVYARRFAALARVAREDYGITLAQENVDRCRCGLPENVRLLRDYTDDTAAFVLDLKQARRAGQDPFALLEAMDPRNVRHLHLSDADDQRTSLPPGEGTFDFARLYRTLRQAGNHCDGVVELYRADFTDLHQLADSAGRINRLIADLEKEEA